MHATGRQSHVGWMVPDGAPIQYGKQRGRRGSGGLGNGATLRTFRVGSFSGGSRYSGS